MGVSMGDGMTERVKHWDAKWEGNCAVRTKNTMEKQSWWSMRPAPIRTIMIHMDKLIQDGVPYINDGTIRNETPRFEDVTPIWIVMKPWQCLFCATSATINLSYPPPPHILPRVSTLHTSRKSFVSVFDARYEYLFDYSRNCANYANRKRLHISSKLTCAISH